MQLLISAPKDNQTKIYKIYSPQETISITLETNITNYKEVAEQVLGEYCEQLDRIEEMLDIIAPNNYK